MRLFDLSLRRSNGFTIIELLIVVVVIAILAVLVLNSFSGVQDKARYARANDDMQVLKKAIMVARINTGLSLISITGSGYTAGSCAGKQPFKALPKTDSCWTGYRAAVGAIATAANTKLADLMNGDPWGAPYLLDENEAEGSPTSCNPDVLASGGSKGNYAISGSDPTNIILFIPLSTSPCL